MISFNNTSVGDLIMAVYSYLGLPCQMCKCANVQMCKFGIRCCSILVNLLTSADKTHNKNTQSKSHFLTWLLLAYITGNTL